MSASRLDGPPTSGVPVPGANAGSTKSMSKERKHGADPTRFRTRSENRARPERGQLLVGERVEPELAPAGRRPPAAFSDPRRPAWIDRAGSIRPSSSARSDDAPVEELLPEVLVPQVVVRVELDQRERPVHRRERPELGEQHRVVAAEADGRHAGARDLLERRGRALERVHRRSGHRRHVAVVDERELARPRRRPAAGCSCAASRRRSGSPRARSGRRIGTRPPRRSGCRRSRRPRPPGRGRAGVA